jgi:hypothetical protein
MDFSLSRPRLLLPRRRSARARVHLRPSASDVQSSSLRQVGAVVGVVAGDLSRHVHGSVSVLSVAPSTVGRRVAPSTVGWPEIVEEATEEIKNERRRRWRRRRCRINGGRRIGGATDCAAAGR